MDTMAIISWNVSYFAVLLGFGFKSTEAGCYYQNTLYANGEKLNTSPGTACKVCYCQGEEIKCVDVSCYVRKDCKAELLPGQCCPIYKNCPPKGSFVHHTNTNIASNLDFPSGDEVPLESHITEAIASNSAAIKYNNSAQKNVTKNSQSSTIPTLPTGTEENLEEQMFTNTSVNETSFLHNDVPKTNTSKNITASQTNCGALVFKENNKTDNSDDMNNYGLTKNMELANSETRTNSKTRTIRHLATSTKYIMKRNTAPELEADDIFKQLETELNKKNSEKTKTAEEEKEESDKIFQELLNETSTPKSDKETDKEMETLQTIVDTVARFALGGRKSSADGINVLRILSNFFTTQHKTDGKK